MAKAKPNTCPKCGGPARGRGYTHVAPCEPTTSKASTSTGGSRIDGRTSIPNLLRMQIDIEAQLKERGAGEVRKVKVAIEKVDSLREQLAEAKRLAGL